MSQDAESPPPPGRLDRFRHWHRTLGIGNRLAFYALVLTALGVVTPLMAAAWTALTGPSVGLLVEQDNNGCTSIWTVPPGNAELVDDIVANVDPRQLARWEREARIMHRYEVKAPVSIRGGDTPIEIRDLSITVLSRHDPVAGGESTAQSCGGEEPVDEPDYVVVDLDTLPLAAAVPVAYLQQSDQQQAARALADELGEQITLPRTVDARDFYSFTLIGRSAAFDTEWRATITWWDGEEVHTDVLDDDGEPFRVTAAD